MALFIVHFINKSYGWILLFTYLVGLSDWLLFELTCSMACNGVLTPLPPPYKSNPHPQIDNSASPIFFLPTSPLPLPPTPSPQTFYSPPPTGNGWFCISLFFTQATSNKHMFSFLKLLQLFNNYYLTTIITTIKCCHNGFLKKLKQYIKETRFYHHTFLFFCVMTCLSLTLCKKL